MNKTLSKLGGMLALSLAATTCSVSVMADVVQLDRIVAIVNDDAILESELESRLSLVVERLRAGNTRMPAQEILRKQVMDRLVVDNIQLQLAKRQGIRVSERQLDAAMSNIARKNGMSLAQFRSELIAEGRDYDQAREQIRREILLSQVQQANINRRIRISDQELQNFLDAEKKNGGASSDYWLSIILLSLPEQASPEIIQKTAEKADQLYSQLKAGQDFAELAIANSNAPNALQGGDLGWRKGSELPSLLASNAENLKTGDFSQPIKTPNGFYLLKLNDKRGGSVKLVEQRLVSHILLKATEIRNDAQSKRKAEEIYRRLQDGEDFATLARQFSDDAASGSEGGDLEWVQAGQMVPEFEKVMYETRKGNISRPFKSRFGWHLLTVRDIRTEDIGKTVQENRARASIRKRRFNEELNSWLRELRSQAYVEIK
ncbi:peptidylprolyl isomerase [Marinobacterium jannaschii]|uniref:peptidylprolyl isomerase n=1 Tax=Marinobacterium jannaschii TaxID=64970 RepID=UPI0005621DA7|nr:peptidylprolyl isomerase [Marinobacterium jannaschii]